jgi:hypothetical protein
MSENQFILAEPAQEGEPSGGESLYFRKPNWVNSLFGIRVSDLSRTLFLSGTPVPLTVWKGVPYSRESKKM